MQAVNDYRLNSLDEPTDEQLQVIMEGVAEEARRSSQRVEELHQQRLEDVRRQLRAYRQTHSIVL